MVKNSVNGVTFFSFPLLDQTGLVKHGFSSRVGGVSEGQWAELNLGLHNGDEPDRVTENYRRFAEAVGVTADSMVLSAQVHKTNLRKVGAADRGKGIGPSDIRETDGLYTSEPGVTLVTFYADCVPLLFLDPVKRVIAASHSGWRGTAAEIGKITVQTLQREYGSNPADIMAGIGPSIGPCCFEVGADVAEVFLGHQGWAEFVSEPYQLIADGPLKYKVDLWRVNRAILISAGLLPEHIDCDPLCTCCHPDLFYSHRRSGAARGSMAALLALNEA
jgi:YfiH family protein